MNIHTGDPIHGHTARLNNCISFGVLEMCRYMYETREETQSSHDIRP